MLSITPQPAPHPHSPSLPRHNHPIPLLRSLDLPRRRHLILLLRSLVLVRRRILVRLPCLRGYHFHRSSLQLARLGLHPLSLLVEERRASMAECSCPSLDSRIGRSFPKKQAKFLSVTYETQSKQLIIDLLQLSETAQSLIKCHKLCDLARLISIVFS